MVKKILTITALLVVVGILVWGAINRTQAKTSESETTAQNGHGNGSEVLADSYTDPVNDAENGQGNEGHQGTEGNGRNANGTGETESHDTINLFSTTSGNLSAEETAALLYMREEEKLARDVYISLYNLWNLPIFQNISESEQIHMDTVKTLLDHHELDDPASSEIGVFTNPDLQALYNDLIARGSQSLAEALKVGAAIEEIDILDLQERLAQTENTDIQNVFNNLLNGSYNHLRAFVSNLNNQTGETYQPQYLTEEAYQAIISAATSNGGGRGGKGGNGGGGQGHSDQP